MSIYKQLNAMRDLKQINYFSDINWQQLAERGADVCARVIMFAQLYWQSVTVLTVWKCSDLSAMVSICHGFNCINACFLNLVLFSLFDKWPVRMIWGNKSYLRVQGLGHRAWPLIGLISNWLQLNTNSSKHTLIFQHIIIIVVA